MFEANFDGLVGPTHHYAGLSFGNRASTSHGGEIANPKLAALQGLEKMWALKSLGLPQGFIPPNLRPNIAFLHALGFSGTDKQIVEKAFKKDLKLVQIAFSASSMWTANAATVTPSIDSLDGRVHFTPANLLEKLHRALEPTQTERLLRTIFHNEKYFKVHTALPSHAEYADEGAANHTRLCSTQAEKGLHLFVYGREDAAHHPTKKYPARQTRVAQSTIARRHQISDDQALYIQQNPDVIDAGVFHNDVIAVGHQNVLFFHEHAFADKTTALKNISAFFGDAPHYLLEVPNASVGVEDAVKSYLFNSQLITTPGTDHMTLIVPSECAEIASVQTYLDQMTEDTSHPINDYKVFDLRQSMQNGGGPACLRLRVPLSKEELAAVNQNFLIDKNRLQTLKDWVNQYYRDKLSVEDFRDPTLIDELETAYSSLAELLKIPKNSWT